MALQAPPAVGGDIISQLLNDWHSYFESEKIGKSYLPYKDAREFGVVGDGVIDDTAPIQAALDSGGLILFPPGRYRVTDTLKIDKTVFLKGVGFSILNKLDNASTIYFENTVENKELFRSTVPNIRIENLYFEGDGFNTDRRTWSKCFIFDKGTVYGDTDATISKCEFVSFCTSVELEGRGLFIRDTTFVEQWNPIVLKHFNNDETVNPPEYDQQTNKRGFRKFQFLDNQFHACQGHAFVCESTSSNNYEKYIHQVVVVGNRLDGTGGFWSGYLGGGVVTGNTAGKAGGSVYGMDINTFDIAGMQNVTISGNVFASEFDMDDVLGRNVSLATVFYIRIGGIFESVNIDGNTIINVGQKIMYCGTDFFRISFTNNVVNGVLRKQQLAGAAAFRFVELGEKLKIKNNIINDTDGVTHNYLAEFALRGVAEYDIEDNIVDKSEFSVTHNLYPWNKSDSTIYHNYSGDGSGGQTFTFSSPVDYVIVTDYVNEKTIMKRAGTANGDAFVSIADNTVTFSGAFNTSGINYSAVIECC